MSFVSLFYCMSNGHSSIDKRSVGVNFLETNNVQNQDTQEDRSTAGEVRRTSEAIDTEANINMYILTLLAY